MLGGLIHLRNVSGTQKNVLWSGKGNEKSISFQEFKRIKQKFLAKDKSGKLVFLADSPFSLQLVQDKYVDLEFNFISEF